ncbi:hypothetical protein B0J18DRAFT_468892 [Chaetomium sp. MPI-SDFR-AT-0129]|nr:hypothetical protein B0J18DRAFT_468892 [Chaetomium sp. MPI-SDFR-AT-0129]
MNFAGFGNPPHSPPARATHCALVGGASAPLRGSLRRLFSVPFRTSPPSRGALRSAGVPTIAANTTLAPQRSFAAASRKTYGAREYPKRAEVSGSVGDWRFATPVLIAFGGTYQLGTRSALNLLVGPPLGALRR